jgi:hypothetical protein
MATVAEQSVLSREVLLCRYSLFLQEIPKGAFVRRCLALLASRICKRWLLRSSISSVNTLQIILDVLLQESSGRRLHVDAPFSKRQSYCSPKPLIIIIIIISYKVSVIKHHALPEACCCLEELSGPLPRRLTRRLWGGCFRIFNIRSLTNFTRLYSFHQRNKHQSKS